MYMWGDVRKRLQITYSFYFSFSFHGRQLLHLIYVELNDEIKNTCIRIEIETQQITAISIGFRSTETQRTESNPNPN